MWTRCVKSGLIAGLSEFSEGRDAALDHQGASTPMDVRYYRINRAAYTVRELSAVTLGQRRILLPALIARLFFLKLIGKPVPIGDPIAEVRLTATLDAHEAGDIRKRHVLFQAAESALPGLGITQSGADQARSKCGAIEQISREQFRHPSPSIANHADDTQAEQQQA
jgi:hypothetical protein